MVSFGEDVVKPSNQKLWEMTGGQFYIRSAVIQKGGKTEIRVENLNDYMVKHPDIPGEKVYGYCVWSTSADPYMVVGGKCLIPTFDHELSHLKFGLTDHQGNCLMDAYAGCPMHYCSQCWSEFGSRKPKYTVDPSATASGAAPVTVIEVK
jgi:hypothetical protein